MMNKTVEIAINKQIKNEFSSAYIYLAMSAFCESKNLPGFANWLRQQYQEETAHALRLFDFLSDRGGKITLHALEAPSSDFSTPVQVFESVLAHEKKVTAMINELYALAVKENDYPTQVEMQWFITEQVEEEKTASDILEQLKLAGGNNTALLILDRELGSRTGGSTA